MTESGPALLTRLNVREADLIPVTQKVTAANDVPLTILGAVIVKLTSVSTPRRTTLQLCYISKECHGMYLSLSACKNLGIVHAAFPEPVSRVNSIADAPKTTHNTDSCKRVDVSHTYPTAPCGCPVRARPPPLPTKLPFPASETEKLKKWILEKYAASAFNV